MKEKKKTLPRTLIFNEKIYKNVKYIVGTKREVEEVAKKAREVWGDRARPHKFEGKWFLYTRAGKKG